jgi:hypothetical protein
VIEVNRRPVIDLDKEQEIDKRRKDIAKQKEARERKMKLEVRGNNPFEKLVQIEVLYLGRQFSQTARTDEEREVCEYQTRSRAVSIEIER